MKFNKRDQFFKGGIAFKLVNSLNVAYLYGANGTFDYQAPSGGQPGIPLFGASGQLIPDGSTLEYRQSDNRYELDTRNLGYGVDIGFIYEYR